MDDLPPPLIVEILSRLNDSADLARCRLVSKALNALSCEVRSINLHCSSHRYAKSRSPAFSPLVTPFKGIFMDLISKLRYVESIEISVEKPLPDAPYDDLEDELDDLYLTGEEFVAEWLPAVAGRLRSISISDFWIQSCWRRSEILSLISSCCHSLVEFELKNTWLSVDRLKPMPMLTSLTLKCTRLDDEDLNKVNDCFPSLGVLNLIGVGGLREPKIQLHHLRACEWSASNAPLSLTILAPNLVKLKLKCVKPQLVVIDAPLLTDFYLSIDKTNKLKLEEFLHLKTLQLESNNLFHLLENLPSGKTVKFLTLGTLNLAEFGNSERLSLERLFIVFPNVKFLNMGPGAWFQAETCFRIGLEFTGAMKGLRELTAHLFVNDLENTLSFIFYLLEKCIDLTDMSLLVHREVKVSILNDLVSRCVAHCAKVRWRWGLWGEGMKDAWVSVGI